MKKVLLFAATVALLFATSCKKDANAPENIQLGENEFLVSIDNGAVPQNAPAIHDGMNTMTTIDGDHRVFWEKDIDVITINGQPYTATESGTTVIFTGEGAGDGPDYHAFYPVDIQTSDGDERGILPDEQTYYGNKGNGQIDVRNLPMYAKGGSDKQLTFHNICAVLKITVPSYAAGATSIVVSSDQVMNGYFYVDWQNNNFTAVMDGNADNAPGTEKKVTMKPQDNVTFTEDDVVYIAVPAQEYTNLRIEFFEGETSVWQKTIESCELRVNHVIDVNMTPMNCLCFTAVEAGATVSFTLRSDVQDIIQYSTDNIAWVDYTSGDQINLANADDKVYFRAKVNHDEAFGESYIQNASKFAITKKVKASGNIMSLYGPSCPDTQLPSYAFEHMFHDCTTLTEAPELPATTLAERCYGLMFTGCAILTKAPELPATTLAEYCYENMFENCTSLSTAPKLPATTLADYCYTGMFYGCTSLEAAPELEATTLADGCYSAMFNGCTSLETAPELEATTLAVSCYEYMFYGCTSLETAPELPAETLVANCYFEMFYNCSKLSEVRIYATDGFEEDQCLDSWLYEAGTAAINPTVYCASSDGNEIEQKIRNSLNPGVWSVEVIGGEEE